MPEQSYHYFEDINWGLLRLWGHRSEKDVLDVGCGFATTSQRIQAQGNRVTGIELSPEALPIAKARLSRVISRDLQDIAGVRSELGDGRFDAVIFADVLEHMAWPLPVLKAYLDFLRPGGCVIVSLPNVGLWDVRLAHLLGQWNYQDTGVLDRTHLRFFTLRTARRLLQDAGLEICRATYNPGVVRPFIPLIKRLLVSPSPEVPHDPSALLGSPAYNFYMQVIHPPERIVASLWPTTLAFQMVFETRREQTT